MRYFSIECVADEPVYARIKRFDGLFYNTFSQTFENDPNANFDLVPGEGLDKNIWSAEIPVEITEEFPPGRYTVYYYGADRLHGAVYETITNENSPNEIANRLANIQIGDTTLRFVLNKLSKQNDEILKKQDEILNILKKS